MMFIHSPYIKCPKCGKNSFGVLLILDDHYLRRCKECAYPHPTRGEPDERFPLPKLNKKVIYLDQFAISQMMKILNPQVKAHTKVDKFWKALFERLDTLCKMQLIVCPDSSFHVDESLLSPYYRPLKRMYELFSHGVTFHNPNSIEMKQLYEHALNWANGNKDAKSTLNINSVIHGKINNWQGRFIITGNIHYPSNLVEDIRKTRKEISKNLLEIFKRWQSESGKSFEYWYEEEVSTLGRLILEKYNQYIMELRKDPSKRPLLAIDRLFRSKYVNMYETVVSAFIKAGIAEKDIESRSIKYLSSPCLKEIPFNKISSMLFAAVARKAAAGMKKPPNIGLNYDIHILSTILPYCDAMLIDNECRSYLEENPLCDEIDYGTNIFSQNNKDELIEYLDEIKNHVSQEHLEKVVEVYGEDWCKPYTELYS